MYSEFLYKNREYGHEFCSFFTSAKVMYFYYVPKNPINIFAYLGTFSTYNATMAAVAGYFKYLKGEFASQDLVPYARLSLKK